MNIADFPMLDRTGLVHMDSNPAVMREVPLAAAVVHILEPKKLLVFAQDPSVWRM